MKTTHHGRKALVAVLAAVACLLSLAPAPASAALVHARLGAGHILTHFDGVTTLVNPEPPPPPICVPPPDATPTTITMTHIVPGSTHIGPGAIVHAGEQDSNLAGIPVRISFQTTGTGLGTVTAGGLIHHQRVHLSMTIRNCAGDTVLCTILATFTLTGSHNSPDNTLSSGETVHVSGASDPLTTGVGCNPLIRAVVLGSTMTLDLNFHML